MDWQTDYLVGDIPTASYKPTRDNWGPIVVAPDGYFVMGDSRDNSEDSRYFGFAERDQIIGKATNVIVSFNILDKYQPRLGRFFTKLD